MVVLGHVTSTYFANRTNKYESVSSFCEPNHSDSILGSLWLQLRENLTQMIILAAMTEKTGLPAQLNSGFT